MRPERIGDAAETSGAIEIAAVDLFSCLFLLATLMISSPTARTVARSQPEPEAPVVVLAGDGLHLDGGGPLSAAALLERIGSGAPIRVRAGPGLSVAQEHDWLARLAADRPVTIEFAPPPPAPARR